jgi:hypothetical protein
MCGSTQTYRALHRLEQQRRTIVTVPRRGPGSTAKKQDRHGPKAHNKAQIIPVVRNPCPQAPNLYAKSAGPKFGRLNPGHFNTHAEA